MENPESQDELALGKLIEDVNYPPKEWDKKIKFSVEKKANKREDGKAGKFDNGVERDWTESWLKS